MTDTMYTIFSDADYPCYWLGHDGEFWMNEAAKGEFSPLGEEAAARHVLVGVSAELSQTSGKTAAAVPMLTDALRMQGLTAMQVEAGLLVVAANAGETPISAFSNQMREPLANIFAILPLLSKKLDEEDNVYPEEIQRNCYELLRLASNMESATVISTGKIKTQLLDFGALVEVLIFCINSVCKQQGVAMTVEAPAVPIMVRGSDRMLGDAVLNIIRNSLQYTRDGNSIHVRLYEVAGRAVLRIEDKGMGIKPEHVEKVFTPYFSAEPYGDGAPRPGIGLGLAVAQQAVKSMGGTVTLESRFGEGTVVTVAVPLAKLQDGQDFLESDPADYLLNRYSHIYVQLCGYCRLPVL